MQILVYAGTSSRKELTEAKTPVSSSIASQGQTSVRTVLLFLGHKWLKNGNWHLIQKQQHSFKQNREYQANFSKLEIVGQSFVQET